MKTKQMLLGLTLTIMTISSANAKSTSTDWTAKLKPMTEGCASVEMYSLSQTLKESIVNQKMEHQNNEEITTYTLENATAFGQPLSKIEQMQSLEWGHMRLYFKNNQFMSLRSQFKLPVDDYGDVVRNDTMGYQVGEGMLVVSLRFDGEQKTITCAY
ncbi:hypothetical protein [Psychrobacter sp. I-STPA6b]|uniref:hypothetical protein n=1 Tax=Psychrobacter sp. I-STPA6b TaxID=2585718 RepID=UPI001D0CCD11|nr:hypothetical protein [Psychrobacter sp. I-STPA6b]